RLNLTLGRALLASRVHTDPEIERTFSRAHALCRGLRPTPSAFRSLSEIWVHRAMLCDGRAFEMAAELEEVAVACKDRHLEALAVGARSQLSHFAGRHQNVFVDAEWALAHLDPSRRFESAALPAADVVSLVHVSMARSAWLLGLPDRARREASLAIVAARE